MREIENDGFITREADLKISEPLEMDSFANRERYGSMIAKPAMECDYPNCDKCSKYLKRGDGKYCTVPMIISKQIFLDLSAKIERMENDITELENALYDEILGEIEDDMPR